MNENGTVHWLLSDHLGSTAITTNNGGGKTSELRYYPFGSEMYNWGNTPTTYRFTGQRSEEAGIGLYFYRARWYDPALGRFVQADTIVPEPGNPQAHDSYAYVYSNPIRYTDPSGVRLIQEGNGCGIDRYDGGAGFDDGLGGNVESPGDDRSHGYEGDLGDDSNPPIIPEDVDEPPPNWFGIGAGGFFVVKGAATTAAEVIVFPEDPPAGAFIMSAGVLLTAVGTEIIYQSLGYLRPSSWPEYQILNPP